MKPTQVADILKNADRIGADKDGPEGIRYIQISDTLAQHMEKAIRSFIDKGQPNVSREFVSDYAHEIVTKILRVEHTPRNSKTEKILLKMLREAGVEVEE